MNKLLGLAFISALTITARIAPENAAGKVNVECSKGAICFSGEVSDGEEFHRIINDKLEFRLRASDWTIEVSPRVTKSGCEEFASVVSPPYRGHNALHFDESYGVTAEEEVSWSPREFEFVTNCEDYSIEAKRLEIVLWPYSFTKQEADKALAELGTSPVGKGRLWVTASRVSHASDTPDDKLGKIEWMRFAVEIRLPN